MGFSVPPTNARRLIQDEVQPAFLILFMVPYILLDLSIDAVVIFHGKRMSLIKAGEINKIGNVRKTQD